MLNNIASKKIYIIVLITVLAITVSVAALFALILNEKTFYKGVRIENVAISGIDKSKAKEKIQQEVNKNFAGKKLSFKYGEREWNIDLNEISYAFLIDSAIESAYRIGREGNFIHRLMTVYNVRGRNVNIALTSQFDRKKLRSILERIKTEIDQKEVDASAIYKNGEVTFNKEIIGKNIDVDKNMELIENILLEKKFSTIELIVDNIYPRIRYNDISVIEKAISTFSTSFNSQKVDRSFNIKLACEKINNTVLLPGDSFSMDEALGPRSISNGYRNAPVIIKGKYLEGVGGGVCQVTTTLYVAVLKSKLEVLERRPHSLPLGYVDAGQDATISEGYIDFKFKNNKEYPVLISAQVSGNNITIRIIGIKEDASQTVKLKSVVVKELPPEKEIIVHDNTIPIGEVIVEKTAITGRRVVVYRETYENNKLIEREKISEDTYQPVRGIIKVNPYATSQLN
ncbi:MAG: vanomycin resistance protein VanB [Clostridiaceae bacterium]|jgi:vancomycin resistance protein YoaR|nr:vanomycin resistance protein VanB [Clostridiaceae bacterium]